MTPEERLSRWFPPAGPCLICERCGFDAQHRLTDAIDSRWRAGENSRPLAKDYGLPVEAVRVVVAAYREARKSHRRLPFRRELAGSEGIGHGR